MKKIKSFLMVLSIIGLFVFASCKNSFTPEQIKVACNTEEIKIKGVAKIGDAFFPKGTIINLMSHPIFVNNCSGFPIEKMIVNDDKGHFESKKQYSIDEMEKFDLLIRQDLIKVFKAEVKASTEEVVYNFVPAHRSPLF